MRKLSKAHYDFWATRQRLPNWARPLFDSPRVSIDNIVELNAGIEKTREERDRENATAGLCSFIRGWRRNKGESVDISLWKYAASETQENHQKRAAYARRWANRLHRQWVRDKSPAPNTLRLIDWENANNMQAKRPQSKSLPVSAKGSLPAILHPSSLRVVTIEYSNPARGDLYRLADWIVSATAGNDVYLVSRNRF